VRRTYKYRAYPTPAQREALHGQVNEACRLYNAALDERRSAWRMQGVSLDYYDQAKQLKVGQGPRGLDRFTAHLVRRWQDGCHVAALLHEELKALGYRGSRRTVRRFVESWRKTKPPPAVRRILPGPQTLCWLLLRRRSELDDADRALLSDLCRRTSALASSRRLAQRFMVLVRE